MAGDTEEETEFGFQWDESSQLYYHASTGFYHDPQAGWYYSTRDQLYYKFEDGKYVLHECNQTDLSACNATEQSDYPPPPSEWLEDTLIEMYLSGYSNQTTYEAENNDIDNPSVQENGDNDSDELEEGEWVPDDPDFWKNFSEKVLAKGVTEEEENWRAQYGQVSSSRSDEEWVSDLQTVDLWDWGLVRGTKKGGKTEVARLVGRLNKSSSKLHPSVPSGGGILKSAPVCEVYFDMVRVTSGRIYRLRTPSSKYLASLSAYEASNPTKDWSFPQLSLKDHTQKLSESQNSEGLAAQKDKSSSSAKLVQSNKDHIYRDRAAERRALHGGFGVGPGQKNSTEASDSVPSYSASQRDVAEAEALNFSFGTGSYARKILEGMGWKEGEALGSSMKGLIEPLQATGNKGTAGLGFTNGCRK
ncbi:D111/G-patch domain-containing protein [Striga hermonthica]|uniref:D111/G-patch domain-containing protein n=1 Tax=Striga hermonthica TaxID=68872 RepID=A0A9N7ND94_STRHE|nr:D111/G-patch domain-containing protein [Striga hermonthica]